MRSTHSLARVLVIVLLLGSCAEGKQSSTFEAQLSLTVVETLNGNGGLMAEVQPSGRESAMDAIRILREFSEEGWESEGDVRVDADFVSVPITAEGFHY